MLVTDAKVFVVCSQLKRQTDICVMIKRLEQSKESQKEESTKFLTKHFNVM